MKLYNLSSFLLALAGSMSAALATDYYISPTGSDANSGTSNNTPWASLSKASSFNYQPGDRILLQRGAEWRDQLRITSSGTEAAPIVVDAYGSGAKPKLWGSDIFSKNLFKPLSGSVYVASYTTTVNAFYADQSFYSNAYLGTNRSTSELDNISYVRQTPNSWYQSRDGKLYVNTGGVDPRKTTKTYTAGVREDLIYVDSADNVTVRNMVVDESAKDDAGYAFRSINAENVRFENSEAYRAGKHHFGVINTKNFVGENLYAAYAMPQQISFSAYVSYSDYRRVGDSSDWNNIVGEHLAGPVFYAHADTVEAMTHVTLKNFIARGGGVAANLGAGQFVVQNGVLEQGASLSIGTDGMLVDGLLVGDNSYISVLANDAILQNIVTKNYSSTTRYNSVIDDHAENTTVRLSTFDILNGRAVSSVDSASTKVYGNIFNRRTDGFSDFLYRWNALTDGITAHDNLYFGNGRIMLMDANFVPHFYTPAQWQAMGFDPNSFTANPLFANLAAGDLTLQAGSPAIAYLNSSLVPNGPLYDFNGNLRAINGNYTLGAFEGSSMVIPEPAMLAPVLGFFALLRRRR